MRYVVYVGLATAVLASAAGKSGGSPHPVTFHRDVLPDFTKNCQGCHRPGEAAPMSFLTYSETRPWAKAIREAVRLEADAALVCRSSRGQVRE